MMPTPGHENQGTGVFLFLQFFFLVGKKILIPVALWSHWHALKFWRHFYNDFYYTLAQVKDSYCEYLAFGCPTTNLGGAPHRPEAYTPLGALKADQDSPPDLHPWIHLPPSIQKCRPSKIGKRVLFPSGICGCQAIPMHLLSFSHARGYHACLLGPPGHVPLAAGELALNPVVHGCSPFLPLLGPKQKVHFQWWRGGTP